MKTRTISSDSTSFYTPPYDQPYIFTRVCAGELFVNFAQARLMWEDEAPPEKRPPSDWPAGKPAGHFLDG